MPVCTCYKREHAQMPHPLKTFLGSVAKPCSSESTNLTVTHHPPAYGGSLGEPVSKTRYRTIMAYDTDCVAAPRVPMFSTPDKSYLGKMLGSESTNNVRKIKESLVRGEMNGLGWRCRLLIAIPVSLGRTIDLALLQSRDRWKGLIFGRAMLEKHQGRSVARWVFWRGRTSECALHPVEGWSASFANLRLPVG